jgi:hypothetical protein
MFSVWFTLGLIAHVSILHFYLGVLLWSGYRLRDRPARFWALHAAPAVVTVLWGVFVLRGALIGGGPTWTWRVIADQSLAWTVGFPVSLIPAALTLAAAAALVLWDARQLWFEGSDAGLFFVGAIFGPVIFVAALAPAWLFPRYFSVSLIFLLLVVARALARLWTVSRAAQVAVAAVVCALAVTNVHNIVWYAVDGHGHASDAVRFMATASPTPSRVTGVPVDLRIAFPLEFYQRVEGLGHPLEYVSNKDAQTPRLEPVEWLVVQNDEDTFVPKATETVAGVPFDLRRQFDAFGPSATRWFVYQREATAR